MLLGDRVLLLRYSDIGDVKTIDEHELIINEFGYCWFGKFGKKPSDKYLKHFLELEEPRIVLFTRFKGKGIAHYCKCIGITSQRPSDGVPKYYKENLYETDREPVVYFKITELKPLNEDALSQYVVSSSGKEIAHDLKKSLSSYYMLQHSSIPIKPKKKKKTPRQKMQMRVSSRECKYKKDEKCNNKKCVNYGYECTRPQHCAKQKVPN